MYKKSKMSKVIHKHRTTHFSVHNHNPSLSAHEFIVYVPIIVLLAEKSKI